MEQTMSFLERLFIFECGALWGIGMAVLYYRFKFYWFKTPEQILYDINVSMNEVKNETKT